MSYKESYEWAKIPTDLPRENLVLVTAKTTQPTDHRWDKDAAIRIFSPTELHDAARSLSRRPIGLNHIEGVEGQIKLSIPEKSLTGYEYAYTVDSQYNP